MVAVELAVLYLVAAGHASQHLILRSDNTGVIDTLAGGRSHNTEQNASLRRIVALLSASCTWATPLYVNTRESR